MSDDEHEVEKKTVHSKIGNLEALKRAVCNKEYDEVAKLLAPYKLYVADYAFADEFEGRPDFIIKNKNRGFIQSDILERKRQYVFVAFSCYKADGKVQFKSFWVVNSNDSLEAILEGDYENFKFTPVSDAKQIVTGFKNGGNEVTISLDYLH